MATCSTNKRPLDSPPVMSPVKKVIVSPSLKDLGNKTPKDRPFKVSIEGNIGAGKSTLIKYFQDFPNIETYGEPISWWRNVDGHNLLDLMYSDITRWLKVFQSYVQLTRLTVQTSKPKNPNTTVQIFERSVQNNRYCFVETAFRNNYLSGPDYAVLDKWYQWIESNADITLDLIVYLRSSPDVVFDRMKARGRPEENGVSLQYLEDLHKTHEEWLITDDGTFGGIPILVLDANRTLEEIQEQYRENEGRILGFEKRGCVDRGEKERVRKNLSLEL